MIVLDASVALSWCFPDERDAKSESARHLAVREDIIVPAHFTLEVANTLIGGRARGRIGDEAIEAFSHVLRELKIAVADPVAAAEIDTIARDATRMSLTAYDWAYVALARDAAADLVTFDRKLIDAAQRVGVTVAELAAG